MLGFRSPWMTPDLDALRAQARTFVESEIRPHLAGSPSLEVWNKGGRIGFTYRKKRVIPMFCSVNDIGTSRGLLDSVRTRIADWQLWTVMRP